MAGRVFLLGAVGGTAAGLAAAFGNGLLTTEVTLGVASGLAASLFVE